MIQLILAFWKGMELMQWLEVLTSERLGIARYCTISTTFDIIH